MGSSLGALAGIGLLGILVFVVVGIAVGAGILTLAYRVVVGAMPSYLRAMGVVVASGIAAFVVGAITHGSSAVTMVVQFLVGAALINFLLPRENQPIGYGKACLVQLVFLVGEIVIAFLFGVVAVMFFGSMLAGMHH